MDTLPKILGLFICLKGEGARAKQKPYKSESMYRKERNVVSNLSDIERETYKLIRERGEMRIKETRNTNPRMIGALGKLKSKGLIEFEKVYRQMNQFHKLGRKIVKIKGSQKP